jgi:hypothetical protein
MLEIVSTKLINYIMYVKNFCIKKMNALVIYTNAFV